jgi:hypothetical protein
LRVQYLNVNDALFEHDTLLLAVAVYSYVPPPDSDDAASAGSAKRTTLNVSTFSKFAVRLVIPDGTFR